MSQLEYIKNRTLTLSIPEGCSGCIHESNGICLLGFGQKSHDYEDLNFFNVVTGYYGLRNSKNACYQTDCQPVIDNRRVCGLAFEYLCKQGLTAQVNRDSLRDNIPRLLMKTTLRCKSLTLYQGDATWWSGDVLVCPHSSTVKKIAGLSGIDSNFFSGKLPCNEPWLACINYLVPNIDHLINLIINKSETTTISSVCFTANRHGQESVRRQIVKLINAFPNLEEIALCDYQSSTWVDWKLDQMIET